MPDPFLQDDGSTLKNRLGIVNDPKELQEQEREYSSERNETVHAEITGNFDADHLRAIHNHLFQDVYEWAGTMRNDKIVLEGEEIDVASRVAMLSKGESSFLPSRLIDNGLAEVTRLAATDDARSSDRETFANAAGEVLDALNHVHPFREGNGRTQRVFVEQLAARAGHELDFRGVTGERMIAASIEAHSGNNQSLKDILSESLDPDRVALRMDAVQAFQRSNVPINDMFLETAKEGQHVRGQFIGRASEHASVLTENKRIVILPQDALPHSIPPKTPVDMVFSESRADLHDEARGLAARDDLSTDEQNRMIEIMETALTKADLNELRAGESDVLKDFGTREEKINIAEKFLLAEQANGADRTAALEVVSCDREIEEIDRKNAREQDYAEQARESRNHDRDDGYEL